MFMVVRAGSALIGRISELLVSYRWAPTMGPLSYLVQMTDAGSVACSTSRELKYENALGERRRHDSGDNYLDMRRTGHPALLRMWDKRQRGDRAMGYRVEA